MPARGRTVHPLRVPARHPRVGQSGSAAVDVDDVHHADVGRRGHGVRRRPTTNSGHRRRPQRARPGAALAVHRRDGVPPHEARRHRRGGRACLPLVRRSTSVNADAVGHLARAVRSCGPPSWTPPESASSRGVAWVRNPRTGLRTRSVFTGRVKPTATWRPATSPGTTWSAPPGWLATCCAYGRPPVPTTSCAGRSRLRGLRRRPPCSRLAGCRPPTSAGISTEDYVKDLRQGPSCRSPARSTACSTCRRSRGPGHRPAGAAPRAPPSPRSLLRPPGSSR